jgi:hypothetical protein
MATGGGERRPKERRRASEAGGWRGERERERERENTLHICHQI